MLGAPLHGFNEMCQRADGAEWISFNRRRSHPHTGLSALSPDLKFASLRASG